MKDVEHFAEEKGLNDSVELLKKGALIAQDPGNFENLDVFLEEEKEFLRFEADHKWKHPSRLYFTIILCSIGAAVQGWDQTGYAHSYIEIPSIARIDSIQVQRSQLKLSSRVRYRPGRESRQSKSTKRLVAGGSCKCWAIS